MYNDNRQVKMYLRVLCKHSQAEIVTPCGRIYLQIKPVLIVYEGTVYIFGRKGSHKKQLYTNFLIYQHCNIKHLGARYLRKYVAWQKETEVRTKRMQFMVHEFLSVVYRFILKAFLICKGKQHTMSFLSTNIFVFF